MMEPVTYLDDPFWTAWRSIKPLLEKALETADEYAIGDVLHFAHTGQWQTWYAEHSVVFTRIARYPEHTACIVVLAAGNLDEIKRYEPDLVKWATDQGCKYLEIYGRRGWRRAFDGYEEQAAILRKALS